MGRTPFAQSAFSMDVRFTITRGWAHDFSLHCLRTQPHKLYQIPIYTTVLERSVGKLELFIRAEQFIQERDMILGAAVKIVWHLTSAFRQCSPLRLDIPHETRAFIPGICALFGHIPPNVSYIQSNSFKQSLLDNPFPLVFWSSDVHHTYSTICFHKYYCIWIRQPNNACLANGWKTYVQRAFLVLQPYPQTFYPEASRNHHLDTRAPTCGHDVVDADLPKSTFMVVIQNSPST
ncbi:hypothetical protein ABKN59_001986 [Abortiporus biennis]